MPTDRCRYRRLVFLYGGRPRELVNRSQQLARYFAAAMPVTYVPYRSAREWLDREWCAAPWPPLVNAPRIEFLPTPPSVFLGRRWKPAGALTGAIVARRLRAHFRRRQFDL